MNTESFEDYVNSQAAYPQNTSGSTLEAIIAAAGEGYYPR